MAVKTIFLKGQAQVIRKEGIATGVISPGDLVDATPSIAGDAGAIVRQGAADVNAQKAFAMEREVTGDDINTDYAVDDTVLYGVCHAGVEVLANGVGALALAVIVESAAAGAVQAVTTGRAIGRVIEASSGAGPVKIEIL